MATKNRWKALTDKDYEILRRGTLRDARRWSGVKIWQLPSVIRSAKRLMELEAESVMLFDGAEDLIRDLIARDVRIYVLSRNTPGTIRKVMDRYGLADEIEILARRKRSLGSKSAVISRLVRREGFAKQEVWMVGDEVRDIIAAKRAGVNSVAVTWGLQHSTILKKYGPTRTAGSMNTLKKILTA